MTFWRKAEGRKTARPKPLANGLQKKFENWKMPTIHGKSILYGMINFAVGFVKTDCYLDRNKERTMFVWFGKKWNGTCRIFSDQTRIVKSFKSSVLYNFRVMYRVFHLDSYKSKRVLWLHMLPFRFMLETCVHFDFWNKFCF